MRPVAICPIWQMAAGCAFVALPKGRQAAASVAPVVKPMRINAAVLSPQVKEWLSRLAAGVHMPGGRTRASVLNVPGVQRGSGGGGGGNGERGVMPIGLDIGGDAVRMLQLRIGDESSAPEVVAAARSPLREAHDHEGRRGDWEQAGEVVQDLLRRGGFRGRRVIVALPRPMMRIKTVRLAAGSKTDLARQLAQEAQAAFGVDVTKSDVVTHFLPGEALRRGEGREGLLAVIKRADIDRFVGRLHTWGAEVAALDLEPLALYRNAYKFGRRERDHNDAIVIADIGARATRVIVGRGGTISFYKPLQIGGQALHKAVAGALGLSLSEAELICRREARNKPGEQPATDAVSRAIAGARRVVVEDLARELALCLRYYAVTFKGRPPQRVLLSGGAATEALRIALAAAVEPILPLRVESRHPLADADCATAIKDGSGTFIADENDSEWAVALGLALRDAPDNLPNARGASRTEQRRRDEELAAAEAKAREEQELADALSEAELAMVTQHQPEARAA